LVVRGSGGINPSGPKAFINIIVFDKNYKLLDAAWEAVDPGANQVGATPVIAHDYLMREYTAKEEGYVFMYVSNESPTLVDVYFDDVVMTHTKGNLIQYNEYYPFGLQTANSWTRENVTGNNLLGNGGTELNTTSNLYDLDYRNYDPILGRMNGVDPMATKYASLTPYNFSFNDPVTFNDPSGADPDYGITRYTYDDRVDHYRGEFYSGGSTSAQSFHYGGGGSGIINWSYAPNFSQIQRDADAVKSGQMSLEDYGGKYGTSDFGRNITIALLTSGILDRNSIGQAGYYKYTGLHGEGAAGVLATFVLFKRQQQSQGFGEKADISLYRKRGEGVGWKTLLFEYKTGLGPERSVFYQDHPVVQDMINSFVVRQAKKKFERGGRKAMDFVDIEFELWDVPGAGYNMTEQFIGSARVSITPTKDGRIKYQLDNTTDRNSGSIDKGTKSIPRDSNHLTPNGTIYQRLIWWEN